MESKLKHCCIIKKDGHLRSQVPYWLHYNIVQFFSSSYDELQPELNMFYLKNALHIHKMFLQDCEKFKGTNLYSIASKTQGILNDMGLDILSRTHIRGKDTVKTRLDPSSQE